MPGGACVKNPVAWIRDGEGNPVESTNHAEMRFSIPCEIELPPFTLLRRKNDSPPAEG